MTAKAWSANASARCSTRARMRLTRPGPNTVSASSGIGSCMYTKTGTPSHFGSAAANTRKSGIVLTWIAA